MGASVQGDVAMQPGKLGSGFKRDPLANVKDDIEIVKDTSIKPFSEWRKKKRTKKTKATNE
jgi:hypothetical protein